MFKRIVRIFCIWCVNHLFSCTHFFKIKRFLLSISGIYIGKGTKVVGPIYIGTAAKLKIGQNCWIGKDFEVVGNGSVTIGDKCDIAPKVVFSTGSHEISNDPTRRAGEGISYDIYVESGCWIGVRTTIVGNITIGSGSVIGACSLVNKSICENKVCFGVPAKVNKDL